MSQSPPDGVRLDGLPDTGALPGPGSRVAVVVREPRALRATLPLVSVIVPVYNCRERLRACLGALECQTYPADRYEVIVVDNGSTDGSQDVAASFPNVRLAFEPIPGSYAARNRGVVLAWGEVLAFTDADCLPAPGWIESGVAAIGRVDNCGLLGGRVELSYKLPDRPTPLELYERFFDFDQLHSLAAGGFAMTANAFVYAHVMRVVGSFDPNLKSVGDRELGYRIAAAGFARAFAIDAVVQHPARSSWRALLEKRLRVAGGHHDLARQSRRQFLRFVGALFQHLVRRPLRGALMLSRRAPEMRLGEKLRVLGVLTVLCCAEAFERTRLMLGGRSRR